MRTFRRRTYRTPAEFLDDVRFFIGSRSLVNRAMRSGEISPGFRERLMMMVTEVNACRYCSHYHSARSLEAGLSNDELRSLLSGKISEESPAEEIPALLYARHWAEADARPDPGELHHLVETYLEEKAALIQVILRMIRAGNLMGNTLDYLLYRISFGRLGLTARDASQLTG